MRFFCEWIAKKGCMVRTKAVQAFTKIPSREHSLHPSGGMLHYFFDLRQFLTNLQNTTSSLSALPRKRSPAAMASAAERVFAISELLEQILLDLSNGHIPANWQHTKGLFTLQRVCRSTAITIRASPKLRRRMGIGHQSAKDAGPLLRCLRPRALKREEVSLLPFHIGSSSLEPDCSFTLKFHLDLGANEAVALRKYGSQGLGLRLGGRQSYNRKYHSWRKLVLCTAAIPINVRVAVRLPLRLRGSFRTDWLVLSHETSRQWEVVRGWEYVDHVHFGAGEGTLGGLVDALEAIALRGLREHVQKAHSGDKVDVNDRYVCALISPAILGLLFLLGPAFNILKVMSC